MRNNPYSPFPPQESITRREFVGRAAMGVIGLGAMATSRGLFAAESNPFAYDISALAKTDPKLIGYDELKRFSALPPFARHLEIGPNDTLFAAAGNSILALSAEGVRGLEIPLGASARCLAVAADGTIFAGLRDHVEVFDPKGKRLAVWETPGPKTWFTGLAVGVNDVFGADAGNRVVIRFDHSGKVKGRIGGRNPERNVPGFIIPSPYFNVKLHSDGLLRINNPGRHRMELYSFDGDFEGSWGKPGGGIESFCGCCNPVNFAMLPDGRIVTCEKGLPRVKVHGPTGILESVVAGPESFPENTKVGAGGHDTDASLSGLDVAVDSHGRVFILDLVTAEIHVMRRKENGKA